MIISDAFQWFRDFFTDQAKVVPTELDFVKAKRKSWYWDPDTKTVQSIDDCELDLRHEVSSVESLCDFITDNSRPTLVFVGENKITADMGIDCIITMPFQKTPLWRLLERLAAGPSLKQADAIKLVRQEFGPFDVGQKTLTACRSLRIATDTESIQESQAAKFGKSVFASTIGGDAMPDKMVIAAKPYQHSQSARNVDVFLSVDFNRPGHIRFEPNESQMLDAITDEVYHVYNSLNEAFDASKQVFVYQGEYRVQ
jgi:hypothetical protein